MARRIDSRSKRLAELKKEVTRPGFDRHASVLQDLSELPAELQSAAVTALCARTPIQVIVAFPPQIQRGWHYVPKQALLFTSEGVIHLLASIWPNQEPEVTYIKACGLMYMKVTLLLLYGLLEIVAQGQSSPVRLAMEFNTVAWSRLSHPLRGLLKASNRDSSMPTDKAAYTPNLQQAFEALPFKFSNGLKIYGLLPGEELEELLFQASTWKPWFYFFRRPVTSDTLLMLTTHYLVVIQEDLDVKQGWLLSYIPRNCICGIQSQPLGLWDEVSLQLEREGQMADYNLLLASEAVDVWRRQWIRHGGQWQDTPTHTA